MSELVIGVAAIIIAFILFTQLSILSRMSLIMRKLHELSVSMDSEREGGVHFRVSQETGSRRVSYRAQTDLMAQIVLPDGSSHSITVLDISTTGASLEFSERELIKIGETYRLEVKFPGGKEIHAKIKIVRWIEKFEAYGGCFLNLALKEKAILTEFINNLAKRDLDADIGVVS